MYPFDFITQSTAGGTGNDVSEILAIQDIGCLSAVKFFYHFPSPLSLDVISGFVDCDIVKREFSKTIRSAKDLVRINREGEFSADFVIGGTRAVVYFNGSAKRWPQKAIYAFAKSLSAVGYNKILYSDGPRPQCNRCPAGLIKRCIDIEIS